jgi:hypothetical protein
VVVPVDRLLIETMAAGMVSYFEEVIKNLWNVYQLATKRMFCDMLLSFIVIYNEFESISGGMIDYGISASRYQF